MRHNPLHNWKNIDTLRGVLFFAQRVEELTYAYSIPSYKTRSVSLRGLIGEAIQSLRDGAARQSSASHVAYIIDELKSRIKKSPGAKYTLKLPVDSYFALDLENIEEAAGYLAEMLAELNVQKYIDNIQFLVSAEVASTPSKIKLNELAGELTDTLQYIGVSREHLHKVTVECFFGTEEVSDYSVIDKYFSLIHPKIHSYQAFLPVGQNIKQIDSEILESFGITIVKKLNKNITKADHGKFLSQMKDRSLVCISIEVSEYDYYSAAETAKDNVEMLCDLYRVFHHKWDHDIGDFAVVEQSCCESLFKEVNMPGNFMHYIKDNTAQKAQEVLSEALSSVPFVRGPDRVRYMSLVSLHGLSLQSSVSNSQIINIWTCLETIVPPKRSGSGSSSITHVVNSVMPIIMLTYLKKLLLNLLLDLNRWDRAVVKEAFGKYGAFSTAEPIRKLLVIMTDESKPEALQHLLEKLDTFELLRYRLYSMAVLFRSRDGILSKLSEHEDNVRWQIYRIYRERNKIVHSGASNGYAKYLVENAHQYYDDVFEFCQKLSSSLYEINTFDLCFTFSKRHFANYMKNIKDGDFLEHCIWDVDMG